MPDLQYNYHSVQSKPPVQFFYVFFKTFPNGFSHSALTEERKKYIKTNQQSVADSSTDSSLRKGKMASKHDNNLFQTFLQRNFRMASDYCKILVHTPLHVFLFGDNLFFHVQFI